MGAGELPWLRVEMIAALDAVDGDGQGDEGRLVGGDQHGVSRFQVGSPAPCGDKWWL